MEAAAGPVRVQTRTSSLGAARPLPPSADIGPGGQSVGQAAQFCLACLLRPHPSAGCNRRHPPPEQPLAVDQRARRSINARNRLLGRPHQRILGRARSRGPMSALGPFPRTSMRPSARSALPPQRPSLAACIDAWTARRKTVHGKLIIFRVEYRNRPPFRDASAGAGGRSGHVVRMDWVKFAKCGRRGMRRHIIDRHHFPA